MPEAESQPPADWFAQADMDIQAADILMAQDGPLPVVAFHVQQAVEKSLKGFLISVGWPLRRIQDVEILVQEAIARDADFAPFLAPCQRITEYYIETRYPIGIHTLLQSETVQADLKAARTLSQLIRDKVLPRQP